MFLLGGKSGIRNCHVVGFGMFELILLGEGERFTSDFRHGEVSLSCWSKEEEVEEKEKVPPEKKGLFKVNCWEIACFKALLILREMIRLQAFEDDFPSRPPQHGARSTLPPWGAPPSAAEAPIERPQRPMIGCDRTGSAFGCSRRDVQ